MAGVGWGRTALRGGQASGLHEMIGRVVEVPRMGVGKRQGGAIRAGGAKERIISTRARPLQGLHAGR